MAAAAAAIAAASTALSSLSLTRRSSLPFHRNFRSFSPRLRCSFTSAPSTTEHEFNISPAHKAETKIHEPVPLSVEDESATEYYMPWIVRGADGNLAFLTEPPEHLRNAAIDTRTQKKKTTTKKKAAPVKAVDVSEKRSEVPKKHSKAVRRFYNERFGDQSQRLSKVLAAAGVASRRSSEDLIFEGRVTVNGSVCDKPQAKVDPAKDVIYVNGSRLPKKLPPKVYLALNKPKGYICSSGGKEFKSVMDLFEDYLKAWDKTKTGQQKPRMFTVGRLDVATTGLIIVTNDGEFAQKLSHPSSKLTKEYIATIHGDVYKRHLLTMGEGTVVDGVHCTPDLVELLPRQPDSPRPRIRIVVHEGRNHEVRELVKNAGLQMHSLKRTRIGGFKLPPDLGLGKHVELKQSDLKALGWISSKSGEPNEL
ncbi:Putative ribosomal large subunit pseudouridine synthase svr1, chloroplastic [Dionaea muscipula]